MSTVAYVGNFEPEYSTENDVRKAFLEIGWAVAELQENKSSTERIRAVAESSDLLLWTSTWDDAHDLADVRDIVHSLARRGKPSATYHLDTFWATSRGGRRWWTNPMFAMGTVFTADGDHQEKWDRMGVRHEWLRPGIRHDAVGDGTFAQEYECDVALVGSNGVGYHEDCWTYRRELVDALRAICDRRGWTWRNPGGEPRQHDNGKIPRDHRMNDFYASARVTIGDSLCPLKEASHYWSDRAYEAPGRGGFLIMPKIDALSEDYEQRLVEYPWGNYDELEKIIEWWLEHEKERSELVAGQQEIVKESHTYINRVQTILERVL